MRLPPRSTLSDTVVPDTTLFRSGGTSGSATYTGRFGESFTAKAMYGINKSKALTYSPADTLCSQVIIDSSYNAAYTALGRPPVSCHPFTGTSVVDHRSEEHTSELQSLMRISYAVFCLKKKT